MEKQLNNNIQNIEVPGTRQFSNKVDQYPDSVDLTLGQSGFDTPEPIRKAMVDAINNNKLRYTHNRGLLELRQVISDYIFERFNVRYNPEEEIVVMTGGSEAIDNILRTILNPGDEVILPAPSYLGYEPIIKLCGAKVVYVDTTKTDLVPTANAIKEKITDKTKAVLFNYPTNPTGTSLSYENIKEIVEVLKDEDIFIVTDEIYSDNVYEGKHHSFMEFEEIRNKLFVVNGLSKSHAMTGARIGYILSTPELSDLVNTVHLYNTICASTPSQYGAIAAFRDVPKEDLEAMNDAYKTRRDYLFDRLTGMGLPVEKPTGAFYIFPDISEYSNDSFQFCLDLIEQEQLAVVPGASFSPYGEGHIRLSFAATMEELVEACNRLENFLKNYKK